jgi:CheY-like chemotaxis protein
MKRMLSGHEVVALEDAREVVRRVAAGESFDVILCDILMPRMTGIELYERMLTDDPEAARRIVFLSGGAVDVRTSDFLASVPNVCVEKPVSANALRALIQQRLGSS